jgi:hypothetical protein
MGGAVVKAVVKAVIKAVIKAVLAASAAAALLLAGPRPAAACRSLSFQLTADCFRAPTDAACAFDPAHPDLGPQVAVWIESADRTQFIDTVLVTNAVALYGIGNRPGLWDLRSGPRFPYGRRVMALPVWAHARGKLYDGVVMQNGREDRLMGHEGDSSPEPHFCRPMLVTEIVDAVTCASGLFRSDKGILDPGTPSYFPPRADLLDLGDDVCPYLPNHPNGSCSFGDSAQYGFINDVDAVAAATPAPGVLAGGSWRIPDALPAGDYALMVEVAKEYDGNGVYTHTSFATTQDYAVYGVDGNVGQPSVLFRIPFSLAAAAVSPPDGTLSTSPGSGVGRLSITDGPGGAGRVHLAITSCGAADCTALGPPPAVGLVVDPIAISAQAATVSFRQVGDGPDPVLSYDVRFQSFPAGYLKPLDPVDFPRWTPAPYVAPAAPNSTSDVRLVGLTPNGHYAVGVRATGRCGASDVSYAWFATPRLERTQLSGCFVATAAFGSDVDPDVAAMRRVRDRAAGGSALAFVAADIYRRAAPAAARELGRSDVLRAAVRAPLRPLAALSRLAALALDRAGGPGRAAPGAPAPKTNR